MDIARVSPDGAGSGAGGAPTGAAGELTAGPVAAGGARPGSRPGRITQNTMPAAITTGATAAAAHDPTGHHARLTGWSRAATVPPNSARTASSALISPRQR